jgi:hypothetical protein
MLTKWFEMAFESRYGRQSMHLATDGVLRRANDMRVRVTYNETGEGAVVIETLWAGPDALASLSESDTAKDHQTTILDSWQIETRTALRHTCQVYKQGISKLVLFRYYEKVETDEERRLGRQLWASFEDNQNVNDYNRGKNKNNPNNDSLTGDEQQGQPALARPASNAAAAVALGPPNFTGRWVFDKARSGDKAGDMLEFLRLLGVAWVQRKLSQKNSTFDIVHTADRFAIRAQSTIGNHNTNFIVDGGWHNIEVWPVGVGQAKVELERTVVAITVRFESGKFLVDRRRLVNSQGAAQGMMQILTLHDSDDVVLCVVNRYFVKQAVP